MPASPQRWGHTPALPALAPRACVELDLPKNPPQPAWTGQEDVHLRRSRPRDEGAANRGRHLSHVGLKSDHCMNSSEFSGKEILLKELVKSFTP